MPNNRIIKPCTSSSLGMEEAAGARQRIRKLMKAGILVSPDCVEALCNCQDIDRRVSLLKAKALDLAVLTREVNELVDLKPESVNDVNWREFERSRVLSEKRQDARLYTRFLEFINGGSASLEPEHGTVADNAGSKIITAEDALVPPLENPAAARVKIVFSYDQPPSSRTVPDFVSLFNARYKAIEAILSNRHELSALTTISRIKAKREKDSVNFIGMVSDIQFTKNNNAIMTFEDPTGSIKALISKNKPELLELARNIVLDEVIGIAGVAAGNDEIVYVNRLLMPDIPMSSELKKAPDEGYAVFLSDLHVGSNKFLPDDFSKFLRWIKGELGSEKQRAIASKVQYIFIIGDLVDGVGIYPDQQSELVVDDIYAQYELCTELLEQIPQHIPLIICPGNHDAIRLSEPQPALGTGFSAALARLKNAVFISNPAVVNIHSSPGFPGFNVLVYHGYSFDYYVANVDSIRAQGGYDRADLIMKFLLQRRHLAPSHSSTLYVADPSMDHLVISSIPDFFVTGHIHKCCVANYRNITLLCGSCWQGKTSFQEKVGHHPEPARVPIVNLQTRDVKVLKFGE